MKKIANFTLLILAITLAQAAAWVSAQEGKIVPYVPTPQEVVDRMLELAQVKKGDVVYDLGSGDGRIVVTAAKKYGVRAIGFEIDPERIKESHANIKKAGVEKLVEIRQQDIRTVDLSGASVLTMYLLPEVNLMIRPNIWKQMKPGSRIVSHDFDMGDWKPLKTENIKDGSSWDHTLYLWHVEGAK
ncbi:MAG: SAM-dependent methyltransferase, partial [Candidatus Binatia bacterium]